MMKSLGEVEEQREGKENKHLSNENSLKKQKKEKRQLVKKKKKEGNVLCIQTFSHKC